MPLTFEEFQAQRRAAGVPAAGQPAQTQKPSMINPTPDRSPEAVMASKPWYKNIYSSNPILQMLGGATKGVVETIKGVGELGATGLSKIPGMPSTEFTKPASEQIGKFLERKGVAEKAGGFVGEIAPYFTGVGEAALATKAPKIVQRTMAGVKAGLTTYGQTKDPKAALLAGTAEAVLPGVAELPGVQKVLRPVQEAVGKAAGWVAKKSYAQAFKFLLGTELTQKASEKMATAKPWGTAGTIKRGAEKAMEKYDAAFTKLMQGPIGDKLVSVDQFLDDAMVKWEQHSASLFKGAPEEEMVLGKAAMREPLTPTGTTRQKTVDTIRDRIISKADEMGNMTLRTLDTLKKRMGAEIKPLFKKRYGDLSPEQQAEMDIYYAMRDAVAGHSPEAAAENAKYHLSKIISDAMSRKEALELRQNWTSLIGNVHAAGQLVQGNVLRAIGAIIGDKIIGGTLGRTTVGVTAKTISDFLIKNYSIAPEIAASVAPMISQYTQQKEGTKTETGPLVQPQGKMSFEEFKKARRQAGIPETVSP